MCIYNQVDKSGAQDHQDEPVVNTTVANPLRVGFLRSENRFLQIITNESTITEPSFVINDARNTLLRAYNYLVQVRVGNGKQSYCPFVKFIEKENGYYAKCFHKKLTEDYLTHIADELQQKFKSVSNSETSMNQKVDPTTTVAILTNKNAVTDESYQLIVKVRDKVRLSFLQQGLMVAYMHPYHELGGKSKKGILDPTAPMYLAEVPLLMVRRMHKEDIIFMNTDAEKEAYGKYFGQIAPASCPFHKK